MWSSLLLVELSSRISSRSLTPSKKLARSRSEIWIAHCYLWSYLDILCLWITLLLWKLVALHCKYGLFELHFLVIPFGKLLCLRIALLLDKLLPCIASMTLNCNFSSFYLEILVLLNVCTLVLNIMPLITIVSFILEMWCPQISLLNGVHIDGIEVSPIGVWQRCRSYKFLGTCPKPVPSESRSPKEHRGCWHTLHICCFQWLCRLFPIKSPPGRPYIPSKRQSYNLWKWRCER